MSASDEPTDVPIPAYTTLEHIAEEVFSGKDQSNLRSSPPESMKAHANQANQQVTALFRRYAQSTPIAPGSDMFKQATRLATLYGAMLYFRSIYQRTQADQYAITYKEASEALMDYLKVEPTGRQSSFSFEVTDREARRLVPYSQVGLAGSQEYLLS